MGYSRNGMQRKKGYKRRQPMPSLHFAPAADQSSSDRRNGLALTLTRTTEHAYHNAAGTLVKAASGAFAFPHSYDGSVWSADGVASHVAATNLCTDSEDIVATADWAEGSGGVTVTENAITAPDGTLTMNLLETIDSNIDRLEIPYTVTAGAVYNLSFYTKNDDAVTSVIVIRDTTGNTSEGSMKLTWTGAVPALTDNGGTTTVTNMVVDDLSNGMYRVSGAFTADATNTTHATWLFPDSTSNGLGAHFWGHQVTAGAYVKPYIKTAGAAATRNKDDMQTADITWFRADQGMFVIDWKARSTTNSQVIFAVHDNSASDRIMAESDATEGIRWFMTDGSSDQIDADVNATTADNVASKIAYGYKLNDSVAVDDGNAPVTDAACTIPTMTTFSVAQRYDETLQLGGSIAEIFYVRKRNSNSFAQTRSI